MTSGNKMLNKDYSHNRVKEARIIDKPYREWIRTLPCSVRGCNDRHMDDHHPISSRFESRKRFGKAHDTETQPLCRPHHTELHDRTGSEPEFEKKYGLDFKKNVKILNEQYKSP